MKIFFGFVLIGIAVLLFVARSGDSTPSTPSRPDYAYGNNSDTDYSITDSCDEIYQDYMSQEPGSTEERWALEAAEEKGC